MPTQEIQELKDCFVSQLLPLRIYLFGSFANGTYTNESDFDFFIVVSDKVTDLAAEAAKAYKAIRWVAKRSVDIVVGTQSGFERRKNMHSVESEVYQKGVLLYESRSDAVD